MKQKFKILSIIIVAILAIHFDLSLCETYEKKQVVSKIEKYYLVHNKYPISLKELGYDDSQFGIEVNGKGYKVYYYTSLGENDTYDSVIKQWDY